MKLFTEKDIYNQNKHFSFRLRNLYLKNKKEFYSIEDFIQHPIYINDRVNHNYHFFSKSFYSKGEEVAKLRELGKPYLKTISNTKLLIQSEQLAKKFHLKNDYNDVCTYLQSVQLNGKMTSYFTSKILINDQLTLNTSLFPSDCQIMNKVFKELIPSGEDNLNNWLRFQTLTKREKEILKLIANDYSTKAISDLLFLSAHSVKTHRRNIYKKLDINKTSQLVRIAIAMELLQ
ncbi:response regulator transcription factor [Zunongwangia sp.]|uniref:response regulator transcription factor n=1 Tax=Zunongwangia sp. TaxID=1965325 RepID=UPI003AA852C0